jgi:hypothetical protein
MKLEFLDDISDGGRFPQVVSNQLIRLYDFDSIQAATLKENIEEKILKGNRTLDLSSLDFVQSVNCKLIFVISQQDEGIKTIDRVNFECLLTDQLYQEMIQLIEPFCEGAEGYQWLYDLDCSIDLLLSPGGTW